MNIPIRYLARHPKPYRTESLFGFYLRLSEVNGFGSPWELFQRAGMKQSEWKTRAAKTEKIALIARCRKEDLDHIAHYVESMPRAFRLLVHPITATDIDLRSSRLCVQCVREKGFVEAQWDLALMVGCPLHCEWATCICASCGARLTVFRPGLLVCRCGAVLRTVSSGLMSPGVRSLLEIVRARALELLPFAEFGAMLPVADLHRLELRTLLRLIEILGKCKLNISRCQSHRIEVRYIMESAASVLEGWPANFHAMLHSLSERNAVGGQISDIRRQFAPFYSSMFKRVMADREEDIDFIRREFLEFASSGWNMRRIDPRALKRVRQQIKPAYVSRAELARRMRIDSRTIKRFELLRPESLQRGPNETYCLEAEALSCTKERDGSVMRLREAAAEIQIPVSVLRILKQNGEYRVTRRLPTQPGFRKEDVILFRNRLLGLAPTNSHFLTANGLTALKKYMRKGQYSVVEKVSLIVGMLHGNVPVFGNEDGSVKGLLLCPELVLQFMTQQRGACKQPAKMH